DPKDRRSELLPFVYRLRDSAQGEPLRALLQVIGEQVDVVEEDIRQLYDNWFVETCQDWVLPYLGDLVGYQALREAEADDRAPDRIIPPRSDVANTIRDRRRKGTVAILEQIAADVAGWPARAVEFYARLAVTQPATLFRLQAAGSPHRTG